MIKTGGGEGGVKTYRNVVYFLSAISYVFFTAGLLEIIMTVENPKWFLIIPIRLRYILTASTGPVLTTIGLTQICLGAVSSICYNKQLVWYVKELKKSLRPRINRNSQ